MARENTGIGALSPVKTQAELDELTAEYEASVAEAEKARRAADRVISVTWASSGLVALTEMGRMFVRELDNRNFDGRNPFQYAWREIRGPLD